MADFKKLVGGSGIQKEFVVGVEATNQELIMLNGG